MLHNVINHYILTCGSICGAVQLVYKFFAVQCGMRTELSGAVQFADKNFAHRTISSRGHKARGQGHKKIRDEGQGPTYRGQTLLKPRTEMLEAKDATMQVFKKKGLLANFPQNISPSPKRKKRSSRKKSQNFSQNFGRRKTGHDISPFLATQKIVAFSMTSRL